MTYEVEICGPLPTVWDWNLTLVSLFSRVKANVTWASQLCGRHHHYAGCVNKLVWIRCIDLIISPKTIKFSDLDRDSRILAAISHDFHRFKQIFGRRGFYNTKPCISNVILLLRLELFADALEI